jgi:hypothetical protein
VGVRELTKEELEERINVVSYHIKKDVEMERKMGCFCLNHVTRCKEEYVRITGTNYDPHQIDRYTLPAHPLSVYLKPSQ